MFPLFRIELNYCFAPPFSLCALFIVLFLLRDASMLCGGFPLLSLSGGCCCWLPKVPRREEYLGAVLLLRCCYCYWMLVVGDWVVSFGLRPLICWLVAVLAPAEMSGLGIIYYWPLVDIGGRMCPFCCLNICTRF